MKFSGCFRFIYYIYVISTISFAFENFPKQEIFQTLSSISQYICTFRFEKRCNIWLPFIYNILANCSLLFSFNYIYYSFKTFQRILTFFSFFIQSVSIRVISQHFKFTFNWLSSSNRVFEDMRQRAWQVQKKNILLS